ncbi:MAG: ankyrin repeat domain-containing protein [Nitrospira sp.]|nr:ankyrin repeat domain-containing protein [Nitrospira sp.]
MHLAARKGRLDACKALVSLGLDVNITEFSAHGVPLDEAATAGHLRIVEWMLGLGASVDGLPTSVATPLMGAAIEGHLDIARRLLEAGAEINREHLKLPQTALDFAELYRVKKNGQDAVADLLRKQGGIRPYFEKHDWNGVFGQHYIEHIERSVGGFVNPHPISHEKIGEGVVLSIYRVRIPTKYDFQLLFTVGLISTGLEICLCLPSAWPINRSSMQEPRFNWPVRLLEKLGAAHVAGLDVHHGQVITATHPVLVEVGQEMPDWIVALNKTIEAEREGDAQIPQTLILVPVSARNTMKSKNQINSFAVKIMQSKWDKIAVPLASPHDSVTR